MTIALPGLADFEPLLGDEFEVTGEGLPPLQLRLVEVQPLQPNPINEKLGRVPFGLLFEGASAGPIPQGQYDFHHDRLGNTPIFMTPCGQIDGGFQYSATFN